MQRQFDYRVRADGVEDVFRNLSRMIKKGYIHRERSHFGWPLIERYITLVVEPNAPLTVEEGLRTERFTTSANEWACQRRHDGQASDTDLAALMFDANVYASEASLVSAAIVDFDFMCQLIYEAQERDDMTGSSQTDNEN